MSDARLLAAAAAIMPSLGVVAPLGMAPLLSIVAALLVLVEPRRASMIARQLWAVALVLAALALWGALSAGWSLIPGHSLLEATRLALIAAAGLIATAAALSLNDAGRRMVARASLVGLMLGLAVIAIEVFADFPLRRLLSGSASRAIALAALDRGAIVLSLVCWPPILHLAVRRQWLAAGLLFATTLAALIRLISLSALLGLLFAAAIFALAWWRPRTTAMLLAGGFAALTVALPLCPPTRDAVLSLSKAAPAMPSSTHHSRMASCGCSGSTAPSSSRFGGKSM